MRSKESHKPCDSPQLSGEIHEKINNTPNDFIFINIYQL